MTDQNTDNRPECTACTACTDVQPKPRLLNVFKACFQGLVKKQKAKTEETSMEPLIVPQEECKEEEPPKEEGKLVESIFEEKVELPLPPAKEEES